MEPYLGESWIFLNPCCLSCFLSFLRTVASKNVSKTFLKVIKSILWCIKMNCFSMFEKSFFDEKKFFVEISISHRIWFLRFWAKNEVTHHFERRVWPLECTIWFWKCFHRVQRPLVDLQTYYWDVKVSIGEQINPDVCRERFSPPKLGFWNNLAHMVPGGPKNIPG